MFYFNITNVNTANKYIQMHYNNDDAVAVGGAGGDGVIETAMSTNV